MTSIQANVNQGNQMVVDCIPAAARTLHESGMLSLRLHPRHAALQEDLCQWARDNLWDVLTESEIGKIHTAAYGWLACSFWSRSASYQRSLTLLKLMYWFITFDDAIDNSSRMSSDPTEAESYCALFLDIVFRHGRKSTKTRPELLKEAKHKYSSSEVLPLRLGAEWWEDMKRDGMPISQQARFEAAATEYVMAQVQTVRWNEQLALKGKAPSLPDYITVRRVAVGAPLCIVASEYDLGIDLDIDILLDPLVQALQAAVSDHVAWINDILSFPKELRLGEVLNLVCLLPIHNNPCAASGLDPAAALNGNEGGRSSFGAAACRAWEMTASRHEECVGLASRIMDSPHLSANPNMEDYVRAICSIAAGNWAWSLKCNRYIDPPATSE
ncbi:hypothetical protein KP509_32G045500 [Ceratopteris richardii]|uniref:Terpene synthase n=1 Tax=Ceratopteris richardii TaxID=49495 RepID=A0A8T2QTJ6_CERRI|nr:hypothetical protein KP509_32G045500 [Ceratopteris richardii]